MLTCDSRLILHIVLAKLHISFMAMLLRMSEDSADGELPEREVGRSISLQDEKQLRKLLAVSHYAKTQAFWN